MDENDIQKQYDLLYESVSKKLEQQVSSLGSIDTKASILLAVVGVVFAGYLQLLTSSVISFSEFPLFILLEIGAFVSAGFYIFKAFILDNNEVWRDDPRPKNLLEVFAEHSEKGEYWLKSEIIKSMSQSYEHNDILIIKKYDSLLIARRILYFGISLLVLHLLISLLICW